MRNYDMRSRADEVLSGLSYTINGTSDGTFIRLPEVVGSDYHFEGWVDPEEAFFEVRAVLNEAWQRTFPNRDYFWYQLFETVGSDTPEKVVREFLETLRLVATHDTRICQRKGFLLWTFRCEHLEDGRWVHVSSNSTFRYSKFHPPQIKERRQWYQAKALAL